MAETSRRKLLRSLGKLPGVQVLHTRRSGERFTPGSRRYYTLDLIQCRRRPAAYVVILSHRNHVTCIQEFISLLEARYYFDTEGDLINLPPAVAALVR